ncbi:MAG TPA: amino acid adenylation domain-containing protein, partial [Thermoanaerobaculia bacterium]|nr:amino acid adenylation domain-containing protein [Thermoanaerobaculia bacterium]
GRMLERAVENPELRISELPLLTAAEEQQLREWNDTAAAYPSGICLHELIEGWVDREPAAVAVSCEGQALTYRELDSAANRLARRLSSLGVGPEVPVAVLVERSLEMVVALLAVLKAGGAYLPLDPGYPADRLTFLLADAGAPVVLAQEGLLPYLPATGARTVPLDGVAAGRGERIPGGPDPSGLAYVIYTSGSTGWPKGTMNAHSGIVNRLLWMQERYGLTPEDRVLQKTPFGFDVSVWELFWPLLTGARLVMARPGGHQDPAYLVRTVRQERITTLHFVPSMLQAFLEAPGVEGCAATLRRVVCSGEALPLELERRFFARLPSVELHNLYGPTEAAVDVTHWTCKREEGRGLVPIGRPVANTEVHVVDRAQKPVPAGVAGELLIGGVQVGRGYLGRPDLTAERFVPDPLSGEPGARLYRTGDLARRLPDGAVDFLGRIDHQVKVRGLRIELGEIESALQEHEAVREAVVLARAVGEGPGAVALVAYVTVRPGVPAPPLAALRQWAGRRLPEYMLPTVLIVLDAMPLSPSGKVDRKALPAPAAPAAGERVPPRTPLEHELAALWSEVLHLPAGSLGVHDSFFALGGSSISGAIVINRLQERLGEIVHVVAIFDAPTVASLAALLAREYPQAVARLWGAASLGEGGGPAAGRKVDAASLAEVRRAIRGLGPLPAALAAEPKNPPAVFVLSPPRSGSTLLRVMLAGHPRLFAPPELELLGFDTLSERRRAFPGRDAFRLEGLVRAVMEALGLPAEEAAAEVERLEAEGASTRLMYRRLQEWIGGRTLVDKTPTYAWDPQALLRAEAGFEAPRYIHLLRHPLGMVRSFEEARIDQIFFQADHPFGRRELAELLWNAAYENTLAFLSGIPRERQHAVRFEDLVRDPEGELRRLCAFLELDYRPEMAEPYQGAPARMTDGLYAESRMLGDVKFHRHGRVDAAVADRWREDRSEESLGEPTRELAWRLGYEVGAPRRWERIAPGAGGPGQPLPLSFSQERLWFLHQLEPESTAYSGPGRVTLSGPVDAAALEASLGEIVRRHAVLRTTFSAVDGQPVQWVSPAGRFGLPQVDLGALPDPEAEARRLAAEDAARPFDLARGPLFRVALLRLGAECHHLLYNLHHIVGDGWSTGVIIREIGAFYTAFFERRAAALPEPPIQYADYAVWQRSWLSGPVLARRLSYWKQRLSGDLPVLRLPVEAPPPGTRPGGARRVLPLAAELRPALEELSRREGVTLFMALLAGFKVFLHRATGLTDLAVGTAVAGRDRPEALGLVGFFVNMLVMRTDLSGGPRFRDVLARVREAAVGAFAHQDLPFEKLVEELGERDRLPFQVAFGLQNAPAERLELPGLTLGFAETSELTPRFDLTVWVMQDASGGLQVSWTYRTDLFTERSVYRMHSHYERLLQSAVRQPEERIHRLEMLTEAERAEREAGEKEAEKRQVEMLLGTRRRGVALPRAETPTDRKGVEG